MCVWGPTSHFTYIMQFNQLIHTVTKNATIVNLSIQIAYVYAKIHNYIVK